MEIKAERNKIRSGLRFLVITEDLNMIQGSKEGVYIASCERDLD